MGVPRIKSIAAEVRFLMFLFSAYVSLDLLEPLPTCRITSAVALRFGIRIDSDTRKADSAEREDRKRRGQETEVRPWR